MDQRKPIVVVTGVAGRIGTALAHELRGDYTVVGLDREPSAAVDDSITFDLTSDDSVELAFRKLRDRHGGHVASVVHLAAYFDFTGEDSPLYQAVNIEGTRRLLRALQDFAVGQFVYSGTMLVHAPAVPGERVDENTPIAPKWAYPRSKAKTEQVVRAEHGDIPYVLLHLAGLYDDATAVPTLSHQIARIYERDVKSHLYAGDPRAGQSLIHIDDMIDAFRRTVDRRAALPPEVTILVGEPDVMSYQALQDALGRLIHGAADWQTLTLPKPVAKAGAHMEATLEPLVPDAIDQGEKPFVRPFMIDMAADHYAFDISRARELLGWEPRHKLADHLPQLVAALKRDPAGWYAANGITPPRWLQIADQRGADAERVRAYHETSYRAEHRRGLWAQFVNAGLASWLIVAPFSLGYASTALMWSDIATGCVVMLASLAALSWRMGAARWLSAAAGVWLLIAPLVFWTPSAAAYLNDTVAGALVVGLAVLVPPIPGISSVAAETGPTLPPGWEFSPSSWFQRLPIIILAVIGFHISHYLAAFQLGHIGGIWDPFFSGTTARANGTEEIITSWVSELWPVPDAGLGAVTYLLEILTGLAGSSRRWRTMPWLVVLFGLMIVPLGIVSITFIVIQPILLGTWCTLCLVAAAAMLLQIPYSLDELVATGQFLARRHKAGRSLLRVFFVGDTDEGEQHETDTFEAPPHAIVAKMLRGGVSFPWNLWLCALIGTWLMFTRATLGATGAMADADHLIGSLVLVFTVTAFAEVARPVRLINAVCGVALLITPFAFAADLPATIAGLLAGTGLILFSIPRGEIGSAYGGWNRYLV